MSKQKTFVSRYYTFMEFSVISNLRHRVRLHDSCIMHVYFWEYDMELRCLMHVQSDCYQNTSYAKPIIEIVTKSWSIHINESKTPQSITTKIWHKKTYRTTGSATGWNWQNQCDVKGDRLWNEYFNVTNKYLCKKNCRKHISEGLDNNWYMHVRLHVYVHGL